MHTHLHYSTAHARSYSQLWMSPWGYTTKEPVDFKVQNDVSKMATEAIAKVVPSHPLFAPLLEIQS